MLDDPVPLLVVDHRAVPLFQHPAGARVHEDRPGAAEVAAEAPADPVAGGLRPGGELAQGFGRVDVPAHLPVEVVFVEGRRREVAEVLVDPVAHDPGDGAPMPPGLLPHLLQPGARDVPVVAHVVVVPLHRDRDGRKQPADQRVAPGLRVEPRVLLVVDHLRVRRGLGAAALADLFPGPRRALVDVDLVAEQEQHLRPLVALGPDHFLGQHVEGVVLLAVFVAVLAVDVGLLVRQRHPAGAEADVDRFVAAESADRARRQIGARRRPAALAVEVDLVLVEAVGLEPFDPHQRVVVLFDREGRLAPPQHLDLAGGVGLDPDRRLGLAHVAQQRADRQSWIGILVGHGRHMPGSLGS